MRQTLAFAKNAHGEWEIERLATPTRWGIKVFLTDEEGPESCSHAQLYLSPPGSGAWNGELRRDGFLGWIGDNGLRLLIEDVRDALIRKYTAGSADAQSEQHALIELARSPWVLVKDQGVVAFDFKERNEDDEGWV